MSCATCSNSWSASRSKHARSQEHAQPANTDLQAARDQRDRLRQELEQARQAIEEARTRLNNQSPSYAIVPYVGPHGTRRRPIFVECLDDRVVLQPEGIALLADDFRDPITDDNALASALRAKREYLADVLGDRDGQPYPLLIVPPSGRRRLRCSARRDEILGSRVRLRIGRRNHAVTVPTDRCGVWSTRCRTPWTKRVPGAATCSRSRPPVLVDPTACSAPHTAAASRVRPAPATPVRPWTTTRAVWNPTVKAMAGVSRLRPHSALGRRAPAAGSRSFRESQPGVGIAGGSQDVTEGPDARDLALTDTSPTASADGTSPAASPQQQRADGRMAARDQRGATGRQPGFAAGSAGRTTPNAGSTVPSPAGQESMLPPDAAADSTDPLAASGSAGDGSASSSSSGSSSSADISSESSPQMVSGMLDLSKTRGRNWALSEDAVGATGITRPIRLACYSDRILLLPEDRRSSKPDELVITGSLQDQIDELVSRIGKRIEGWGIAGPGMYWKPVLVVQVPQSAEQRYRELAGLLQNSGIEVKRR